MAAEKSSEVSYSFPDSGASDGDHHHVDERKLLRKLDLRLLPVTGMLYLLSFLDRTNVGNAKLDGLENDLKISNEPSRDV